jgi:hypothetical protein
MGDWPSDIEVNIKDLVVRDFEAVDAAGIGAVIQRELTRLTAGEGPTRARSEGDRHAASDGRISDTGSERATEDVGIEVARVVFRRLGR